jgi:phosphoribosyl 1,2-cyclic phosphodiesterase
MARFSPLFSGSKGNSYYIGCSGGSILIDAGVSAKRLEQALLSIDVSPADIHTIFITHEHIDHIRGLGIFAARYGCAVMATSGTLAALEQSGLSEKIRTLIPIEHGGQTEAAGMQISCFATPHDTPASCGFRVSTPDGRKIGIATDIGCMTAEIRHSLCGCDLVVLESNHDVGMLQNGAYPYYLKRRILSDVGHLSNIKCAEELPVLAKSGTTRFVLGHLSKENNMPVLAYQTSLSALLECGFKEKRDFTLSVAAPQNNERLMVF